MLLAVGEPMNRPSVEDTVVPEIDAVTVSVLSVAPQPSSLYVKYTGLVVTVVLAGEIVALPAATQEEVSAKVAGAVVPTPLSETVSTV